MKQILAALAVFAGLAIASPAIAQDVDLEVYYHPYDYDPSYTNPYRQQWVYTGPIFLDHRGYYRCIKPNGRVGYLATIYGRRLTRYNAWGTRHRALRCR